MPRRREGEQPPPPVVRYAPLGELKVYPVYEHELDVLEQGSPGSLFLNFALFLLPVGITLIVALGTTTISSDRLFETFVLVAAASIIAGLVLLGLRWTGYKGSKNLVKQIKSRMVPPPSIQQLVGVPAAAGEGGPSTQPQPPASAVPMQAPEPPGEPGK